jgi:YidC/Oxa1 family membrane protein insertase
MSSRRWPALLPLSYYALRGQAAQARLQPQVQELRRRHAGHPDRLQRELTALYQREGGGMLAGCLPMLAQLPFFSVMYRLFRSASVDGHQNVLLSHRLLGTPLGGHWLGAAGPLSGQGLVFLGLFALLGLAGWTSARLAGRVTRPGPGQPAQRPAQPAQRSAQPAGQDRVMAVVARVIPFTTVVIAMFVPLAGGIYLLTTTSWTLAERAALQRRAQQASAQNAARAGTAAT